MTAASSNKIVIGLAVTISLVCLLWVCLAAGVEAPTVVVKHTIDEVIRLVTDEPLKAPEQASHRRDLLEKTIGKNFDCEEMPKRSLAAHWKAEMQMTIKNLLPRFENFFPIPMLEK